MPIGRIIGTGVTAVVIAVIGLTAWHALQLQRDLLRAEASVRAIKSAIDSRDDVARDRAISEFQLAASSAASRSDSAWWSILTHAPYVGDDAIGVRVLSRTLSLIATEAVVPMAESMDELDSLKSGNRVDVVAVQSLQEPIQRASQVFTAAATEVNGVDADGLLGMLSQRYKTYARQLNEASVSLNAADTAAQVVPDMLGADRQRNYLMLFQNNAEIRATGGMPGSWALVRADDGKLEMTRQGTAADFPETVEPVLPLTEAETALYGDEYGRYFQDPGFAPDFPRGAELWNAHWERKFPDVDLDGVMALDPVSMSYLLEGTGPVSVGGRTLTSDNVVFELLSRPYLELDGVGQDQFFALAARAIFEAVKGDVSSPLRLLEGFARAAREGRFLVAPFDAQDRGRLHASPVLGVFPGDGGKTPHVDVGLNDATTSKMSYYLRYRAEVRSESCVADRQFLSGRMVLHQVLSPSEAVALPVSVTGSGDEVTDPGAQTVVARIYGPYGGTIDKLTVDGRRLAPGDVGWVIDGRPVATVAVQLSSRDDVIVTWEMLSGPQQTGVGQLGLTPSVLPGDGDSEFASTC